MKIFWSQLASDSLRDVFVYYKEVAGENTAQRIKNEIFARTRQLIKYPESGQIEINLKSLNEGHRYIVTRNYKIIYKPIKEGILISDIFDSRQDPGKMNDPKRKLWD